ncbi:hypothetical protein CONCODRAFT_10796 [Conidiobolus coronatus NRRL 28638]|uniref:Extracellular membrane protein CFEM domain-containing protein n=1 Tax=Conidiobolus coronatus (strain ATCC 28846 / CBS 209.66 / NRRL 28638) TaxID=796925 RepID=A0A137NWU5_CONC2|nr:hypothetical protein CONCODRAFT_10796 [Conidiobolus coronatus NRRL 28638]|eukprot:KXN67197.1 hypothetical protein CONCODRAFT_10796 [Conidiobolus coronatus NRRL 28638]
MKLSIVILAVSILNAQIKEAELDVECHTKVECKILDFMKDAIKSGKDAECKSKSTSTETTKCQLEAFGLNKDQAELAGKVYPYTKQCAAKSVTEFKTCTVGCTKQNDRDACLESCSISLKTEAEECLEKLAGKSTENASKNAKCMVECDKNSYSEIFDCEYNCHKDVLDALASKDSSKEDDNKDSDKLDGGSKKPTNGASKFNSSGSQAKPIGSSQSQSGSSSESSAYLTAQASSLAKITLPILIASFLLSTI